jgi:hypothetical protein
LSSSSDWVGKMPGTQNWRLAESACNALPVCHTPRCCSVTARSSVLIQTGVALLTRTLTSIKFSSLCVPWKVGHNKCNALVKIECVWTRRDSVFYSRFQGSRFSVVGVATGYGLGVGVRVLIGSRIFSSPRRPDRAVGPTQHPIQWVPRALSPGVERPGR